MVFSQIAQDDAYGYFTGITLLNPDALAATVKTEVFDADGISLGALTETFRPGEKKARVITEIVSGAEGHLDGYVKVTSDRPLIGFELFGDATPSQSFLAAVPPQAFGAGTALPAAPRSMSARARLASHARPLRAEEGSLTSKVVRALGKAPVRRPARPDLR